MKREIEWSLIKEMYRITDASPIRLGKLFKVTSAAIYNRAQKEHWERIEHPEPYHDDNKLNQMLTSLRAKFYKNREEELKTFIPEVMQHIDPKEVKEFEKMCWNQIKRMMNTLAREHAAIDALPDLKERVFLHRQLNKTSDMKRLMEIAQCLPSVRMVAVEMEEDNSRAPIQLIINGKEE